MLIISVSCLILTLMILRLEVCQLKRNSGLAMLRCKKSRLLVKCPDIEQEQLPHLIHHHCYIRKWGRTRRTRPQRPVFSIILQVFRFPPKKTATKITEARTLQKCRQAFNKLTKGSYTLDFTFSGFLSHCKMSSFSNSALELCVSSLEASMTLKEIYSLTFIFLILKKSSIMTFSDQKVISCDNFAQQNWEWECRGYHSPEGGLFRVPHFWGSQCHAEGLPLTPHWISRVLLSFSWLIGVLEHSMWEALLVSTKRKSKFFSHSWPASQNLPKP